MYYVLPFGFGDGGPAVRRGEKPLGQKVVPWGIAPTMAENKELQFNPVFRGARGRIPSASHGTLGGRTRS